MSCACRRRPADPFRLRLASGPIGLVLLSLMLGGCSDATGPAGGADRGQQGFRGELDPGGGTFVLQKIDLPPDPGGPAAVELIGSGLIVEADSQIVEITVAIRNVSDRPLHAPATVWISDLRPPEVTVTNPDLARCLGDIETPGLICLAWGFRYEGIFGEDGILSPGEVSGGKPWRFHVPGLASFSFAARLEFGLEPGLPLLGGTIWNDLNANGLRDRGEPPLPAGYVEVAPPAEGPLVTAHPDPMGRWAVPVDLPGLYRVTYFPPPTMGPVPPRVTTPNPLEVVLTPGAPGEPPRGYLDADFGVLLNAPPGVPPLVLTDMPPDSLHRTGFRLQAYEVTGHVLRLHVGFSGCQPRHPFTLFMSGGFAESDPVQARLVLQHDDLGEMCDAWFVADLAFDLAPMIRLYLQQYGSPGLIDVRLLGPDGVVARFRLPIEIRPL